MSEVGSILRNNRVYFSPSLNPDGRTNATRATALGLDPNRDMITLTTPEATSYTRSANAIQPIYTADFHGYTNVLQVEPTGPPHGSNYEYDLLIPHNYALALAVQKHVTEKRIPGNRYWSQPGPTGAPTDTPTDYIKIPYRDTPSGWDDFPPIFTAQISPFYGAMSATVEIPWGRSTISGRSLMTPERAVINQANAYETMVAMVNYLNQPTVARDLLNNQIETFARGVQGTPITALTTANIDSVPGPSEWKAEWDSSDDQETVNLPRAYVIPVGDGQRSESDANRLVQRLLDMGLQVGKLNADTTVNGKTYAKGSYVVDMHQPLRGLANALLDLGEDISQKLPSMYDISAWSLGYVWGATVDKVGSTTDAQPIGATTAIKRVSSNFAMPAEDEYLSFDLAGVPDYQAVNELLDRDVEVTMIEDGSVVIADEDAAAVAEVASKYDIEVTQASKADLEALSAPSAKGLKDLKIAYVGNQDDYLSLTELGFDDLVQISASTVNGNPAILDDIDVIWVGSAFAPSGAGLTATQAWVDNGGAIVGRTAAALNAAKLFGLMNATAVAGNGSGNGIVKVDTPEGSVLEPYKQDYSFVYPAVSFKDLGAGTKAEQSYDAVKPLLAGHWRATNATNGPDAAAGNASVISGQAASGAKSIVFGTSVFFRTHPKGGLSQAARGIFWAAPEGAKVEAPVAADATVKLSLAKSSTSYGQANTATVSVTGEGKAATGDVKLTLNGKSLTTLKLAGGKASFNLSAKTVPGKYALKAQYLGSDKVKAGEASTTVNVLKATPGVSAKAAKSKVSSKKNASVKVTVTLPGAKSVYATGKVQVKVGSKVLKTVNLSASAKGKITVKLPKLKKGKYSLKVEILGNSLQNRAVSNTVKLRVS